MAYSTLKLPTEFVEKKIDPLIDKANGFDSRASVVKEAVRQYFSKMNSQEEHE